MRLPPLLLCVFLTGCVGELSGFAESEGTPENEDGSIGGGENGTGDEVPLLPFEPSPPHVYVPAMKKLLTGEAPSEGELAAVQEDPTELRELVDAWQRTPEAEKKWLQFFGNAFQQVQHLDADLSDQGVLRGDNASVNPTRLAVRESFPRTVLALVKEDRPFHETVTSSRYQMTPALMVYLAYLDNRRVDDRGGVRDAMYTADPTVVVRIQNSAGPIPLQQTLDPSHANYQRWYVSVPLAGDCTSAEISFSGRNVYDRLQEMLFGNVPAGATDGTPGTTCNAFRVPPQLVPEDFTTWKSVTIRAPRAGEATTRFFDLEHMRNADELVLTVPRLGFFSTPAFFANWRTNESNLARVTVNQTLIVGIGRSFDGANATVPVSESGADDEHANPTTTCYACHRALEPMKAYFRKTYSLNSHEQSNATEQAAAASFAFDGVTFNGGSIQDFARTLASHPSFATAWVQKLCFYAASAACSESDPEFQRVAKAFRDSNFNFRVLVRELFSSPLITAASRVQTFDKREVVVSVSRLDHFCGALSIKLGRDACAGRAATLATTLPSDGYTRGAEIPLLNTDTSLFFRKATENICRTLSEQVVDTTGSRYTSAVKDAALTDFVSNLMSMPAGDPRAAIARSILERHHASVVAAGGRAADALRSTFIVACSAPTSVSVGL